MKMKKSWLIFLKVGPYHLMVVIIIAVIKFIVFVSPIICGEHFEHITIHTIAILIVVCCLWQLEVYLKTDLNNIIVPKTNIKQCCRTIEFTLPKVSSFQTRCLPLRLYLVKLKFHVS